MHGVGTLDADTLDGDVLEVDVLVVGSGIAGLSAALRAAEDGARVLGVTKGALGEGSTGLAQGGIAAADGPGDRVADHVADTLAAAAGHAETDAVRLLCAEGPAAVRRLVARGVHFDAADPRDPDGPRARGLEGAHGRARILHAGGDATGAAIQAALAAAVHAAGIEVREHRALLDLVRADAPTGRGRVLGADLLDADGTVHRVRAATTVLATGGLGRLYARTTNPPGATGDGIAAAWRAGAAVADLEFVQFHPTGLADASCADAASDDPADVDVLLISEAVRGEGAVLRDEHGGRLLRGTTGAELAPRDVVARELARVIAAQHGRPVLLDATALGAARLRSRFPGIDARLRAAGRDWSREPVPVAPAQHYLMGGIVTDLDGRTTLPGLLAAGECARTGVHGANRLASNSLLEGAVFGDRAGAAAASAARNADGPWPVRVRGAAAPWPVRTGGAAAPSGPPLIRETGEPEPAAGPLRRPPRDRRELQELVQAVAGPRRCGADLRQARDLLAARPGEGWPGSSDRTAPRSVAVLEDRNLHDLAGLLVEQALARPQSLGAHQRAEDEAAPAAHPAPSSGVGPDLPTPAPSAVPTPATSAAHLPVPTPAPSADPAPCGGAVPRPAALAARP